MDPSQIGPYIVERKLGAGGMGTVYLAHHQESGQEAAVKVLPASLAREEGFVARFSREIDAMTRLKNPHVVELYNSGVDGETYFYAMEFVDGETLTARLKRVRRLDWKDVVGLSLQICGALKAAHDAGIIHRDLKPSNLLLTTDNTVKLTDFGVAQIFAGAKLTVTGGVIGTAEYMSPEQAQGKRVTKKSDLYSLGAVMYVMLTGRPPFTGKSAVDIVQKHKYGQFDKPRTFVPEIPQFLDDVVCQLLEKDPEKRFPDAYVLSLRLKEALKRAELVDKELTLMTGDFDGSSATIATGETSGSVPTKATSPVSAGIGGGTLMRDLVRSEIERTHQTSSLGQWLNNTWVLVGLLALVIAGGVLWFRKPNLTPERQFEAGVALMREEEGSDWLKARDDYFLPLVSLNRDEWEPRVAPYLDQIERYELKRSLRNPSLRRAGKLTSATSEPERILNLARSYFESGDVARAERTLLALKRLVESDPKFETVCRLADSLLGELNSGISPADRDSFRKESLLRAEALDNEGKKGEARGIWKSIIELYEADPHAAQDVDTARKRLSEEKTAGP